ncbi:hypothetical protein OR1_03923 [Geobacter sp. OR-1]|uniref:hypothetical protein n=1 Tax=Geobacter sp. OR-1 TaxID=1266765 RepID=UPI00054256CC|nr:hypothetical protein OR1_03923 [Geobacter sp. OR-1]
MVWTEDHEGQIDRVEQLLSDCRMEMINVVIEKNLDLKSVLLEIDVKSRSRDECNRLVDRLSSIHGVSRIRLE